uniref:Uncharacterized protein n=1 Tax=Octopus bimaculoides TaxID=37653 RepID=A0A0L8GYD3_OCTBM
MPPSVAEILTRSRDSCITTKNHSWYNVRQTIQNITVLLMVALIYYRANGQERVLTLAKELDESICKVKE